MTKEVYINLAVKDLDVATTFYESIGGTKNNTFSDSTATLVSFSEAINFMLITPSKFKSFMPTEKSIADSHTTTEVLVCFSADTRAGVDEMVAKAVKGGGKPIEPAEKQELENMYGRSFQDPDGHILEVIWMDMAALNPSAAKE